MKVTYHISDLVGAAMSKSERDFRKFKALGANLSEDNQYISIEMVEKGTKVVCENEPALPYEQQGE